MMTGRSHYSPLSVGLCLALLVSGLDVSAQQDKGRQGLWHAIDKESGITLFYFVLQDGGSKVYSYDWRRISTGVDLSGDELSFAMPVGVNERHQVKGRFEGGSLSGTYLRPHVQFNWEVEWVGRRITEDGDWDPWRFAVRAEGSVANLLAEIVKAGPFPDQAAFERFWSGIVEPKYYALLTRSLYVDPANNDVLAVRKKVISGYYSALKSDAAKLGAFALGFGQLHASVRSDLKKEYPWIDLEGTAVPLLSLGEFDYEVVKIPDSGPNQRVFLILGADWIQGHLKGTQPKYLVAQSLLMLGHLRKNALAPQIWAEFAVRGLVSFMASKLPYSSDPSDYLFQAEMGGAEREKAFRRFAYYFSKQFKQKSIRVRKEFFFEDQLRSSSYLLAFDFARMLSVRTPIEQLYERLPNDRMRDEIVAYVRSMKTVPTVAVEPSSGAPNSR